MKRAALFVTVASALALVAPAAAAPPWSPPVAAASAPTDIFGSPAIATDAAGDVFVAYSVHGTDSLFFTERRAGGSFSAPVQLASVGIEPQLAADAAGDVVVAWTTSVSSKFVIAGAVIPAGGTPQLLGSLSPTNTDTQTATVASNAAGAAVIAWATTGGALQAVSRTGPGQPFSSPVTLGTTYPDGSSTGGAPVATPLVAVDDNGHATLVYAQAQSAEGQIFAVSSTGASWAQVPVRLSDASQNSAHPALAAAGGTTVAAWLDESTAQPTVFATTGSSSTLFPPSFVNLQQVSDGSNAAANVAVATDAAGDAVADWTEQASGHTVLRAATRPAGGPFSAAALEIHVSDQAGIEVGPFPAVVLPGGTALLAWQASVGATDTTEARTVSAASGLGPVWQVDPASDGVPPMVGAPQPDAYGEVVFGWEPLGGGIELSAYDTVPPTLAAPAVPASANVGVPAAMSVATPFDLWSAPATVAWSFGDGSTASGPAVSHAYAAPGVYTVTVTATDQLGNAASRTAQIDVTKPPVVQISCRVPSLTHLALTSAKSKLKAAHCALGKQKKARRPHSTHGLKYGVLSQSLRANTTHAAATKVNVTLGWYKPPKPKRRK